MRGNFFCVVYCFFVINIISGCSKSNLTPASVEGYWYAETSNWKYYLTFNSDGTGEMEGQATSLSYLMEFAYTFSGNNISIIGIRVYSNGNTDAYNDKYIYDGGKIYNSSKSLEFTRIIGDTHSKKTSSGTHNGKKWIDLGLSVKWATSNIGATSSISIGDYFAWGATEPWYKANSNLENPIWKDGKKGGYTWKNTPYQTVNTDSEEQTKFTKYSGTSSTHKDPSAFSDDAKKLVLDLTDDAAHVNWGGNWRTPTISEFKELGDNCTWTWYSEGNSEFNGVPGYKATSKVPGYAGNYIFLPAQGGWYDTTKIHAAKSVGLYMSSSLVDSAPQDGCCFETMLNYADIHSMPRNVGINVRPVCK